jgi:mRNA interferase MazF
VGSEFGYKHPGLVLSSNAINHSKLGIAVVVPMSTKYKGLPSHVLIQPPEGGVRQRSYIRCEDVRSVSALHLSVRWGAVSGETMENVAYRVKLLLDFE